MEKQTQTGFLVIDNSRVVDAIQDAFTSLDVKVLSAKTSKIVGKSQLAVSFVLEDQIAINGDHMHFALGFKNANNGSTAFTMNLGFFRTICSNGIAFGGIGDNLRIIHRDCGKSRTAVDALPELIKSGLAQRQEIINVVEELQSVKYIDGIQLIGNLNVSPAVKRSALRTLLNPSEAFFHGRQDLYQDTAWAIGNLVNESIRSVHGRSFTAITQNKTLFADVLALAQDQTVKVA